MIHPLRRLQTLFHDAAEYVRDIMAAVREPKAMPAAQRRMDEFKLLSGGALAGAGVVTLDPLGVAGGAEPVIEGAMDLRKAGHKWRLKHPEQHPGA